MDRKVIKYYRKLLKEGFGNAGSLENPSILLDTVGEKIRICGHAAENHMYVHIGIAGDETISDYITGIVIPADGGLVIMDSFPLCAKKAGFKLGNNIIISLTYLEASNIEI